MASLRCFHTTYLLKLSLTGGMAFSDLCVVLPRETSVAVHDEGNVFRNGAALKSLFENPSQGSRGSSHERLSSTRPHSHLIQVTT